MSNLSYTPPLKELKLQAKRLRARLAKDGDFISHSEALELIAHQYGCKDWNTLYAAAGNRLSRRAFTPGARIRGRYLSQPYIGEIIGVQQRASGRMEITVLFDEPVDVVTFDSFSAFRRRVSCTVNEYGESAEKTSDGAPHMIVECVA